MDVWKGCMSARRALGLPVVTHGYNIIIRSVALALWDKDQPLGSTPPLTQESP